MLLDEVRAAEVDSARKFDKFCQQTFGTPYGTQRDIATLGKKAKLLFKQHPGSDWQTIIAVARWCQGKKRRFPASWYYVDQFRYAYSDGAINLNEHHDEDVEKKIAEILAVEKDARWRSMIMRADGTAAKREMVDQWRSARGTLTITH